MLWPGLSVDSMEFDSIWKTSITVARIKMVASRPRMMASTAKRQTHEKARRFNVARSVRAIWFIEERRLLLCAEVALLADASSLAVTIAHVVQLCTTYVALGHNLNLIDDWGVNWEGTLNTSAEGNLANGEGLAYAAALAT